MPVTTSLPTEAAPTADNTIKMEKKETPYGKLFRTLSDNFAQCDSKFSSFFFYC